ncbi:conserved membrane protein of unknown function [Bradyrhizobium sp. ORS 285]|uniref:hypothetical protein n=1 Tax=Bradyrhizobium sp. ORS 285 TaxID=115808 RepID=UPI0002406CF4|nr:hypothetical protein [Bradyrhizobium sp. ORS 285]CCD84925.1 conserved membrane hypothetical protein [Bradyrhizobium sp. ORS 285]SMX55373.1 conserved membrane protein of unknown function [Bradyrhizobium sp. ORS 285]
MSMVGFPLLLIPLAIYNMIVFLMPGVEFGEVVLRLQLPSGELWTISLGDMLLALGVLLLLLEVIKASKPNGKYLTDHLLSLLVFGGAAAEFAMWKKFGNSTFLLLTLLAMVDFFSGIALRTKRAARAVVAAPVPVTPAVAEEPVGHAVPEPAEEPIKPEEPVTSEVHHVEAPAAPPPVLEPATDAVPAAASVAESVLLDRSVPRPAPVQTTGWVAEVKEAEAVAPSAPEPHTAETPKPETPKS